SSRRCIIRKNEIGLQRDEFLRETRHQLHFRRPTSVDSDVAALCPPKLLERLPEYGNESLPFTVVLAMRHQHTDPPHSVRLLRARRDRPRNRRCTEQSKELATLHYSITSSARASNVSGTSMPSAFAVLLL